MKYIHTFLLLFFMMSNLSANISLQDTSISPVPVLCYHHIKADTTRHSPEYTISVKQFVAHIKMLSDSGYHSILPDELYDHYASGSLLPSKPILISFDDGHMEHFTVAAPILELFGFRGVFFIPTETIDKKGFMTSAQIRQISDSGHAIGAHTYDHPDLRKAPLSAYQKQLELPKLFLETVTGKTISSLAYPYGTQNDQVLSAVKAYSYKIAFQLNGTLSRDNPNYTVRRSIVTGHLTSAKLLRQIEKLGQRKDRKGW